MNKNMRGMIFVATLIILFLVITILLALQQHLLVNRYQQRNDGYRFIEQVMINNEINMHRDLAEVPENQLFELQYSDIEISRQTIIPGELPESLLIFLEEKINLEELFTETDMVLYMRTAINDRVSNYLLFYENYPDNVLWMERVPSEVLNGGVVHE